MIVKFIKEHTLIAIIILGLIAIKFLGLAHGYPYIANIDEPAVIRSSLGIRFSFWIDHFDWPHFNFYLNYIFYELFLKIRALIYLIGLKSTLDSYVPILTNEPFVFYFLSRFLNTLASVLTIVPIYLFTKKVFNTKAAILSVFFYLIIPFNLLISHYAVQESIMLFLIMFFVYFAYKATIENSYKYFILTGLLLGLATGVKYNGILFGALFPGFILVSNEFDIKNLFKNIPKYFLFIFSCFLAFLFSIISIFEYWDVFWSDKVGRGIYWQFNSNLDPLSGYEYCNKIVTNTYDLVNALGIPIFFTFIFGFILLIFSLLKFRTYTIDKKKQIGMTSLLYVFSIGLFIYTSKYGRSISHYFVPLYGLIVIAAASAIINFFENISYKFITWILIVGSVLSIMTLSPVVRKFVSPSNYTELAVFIDASDRSKKVYCECNDQLKEFISINNLGYKKYESDEKLMSKDYLVTSKEITSPEFKLINHYKYKDSLTPEIYLYEKL